VEDLFDPDGWKTAAFQATYFFVLIFPFVIPGEHLDVTAAILFKGGAMV
jgi:hypothetical protein